MQALGLEFRLGLCLGRSLASFVTCFFAMLSKAVVAMQHNIAQGQSGDLKSGHGDKPKAFATPTALHVHCTLAALIQKI